MIYKINKRLILEASERSTSLMKGKLTAAANAQNKKLGNDHPTTIKNKAMAPKQGIKLEESSLIQEQMRGATTVGNKAPGSKVAAMNKTYSKFQDSQKPSYTGDSLGTHAKSLAGSAVKPLAVLAVGGAGAAATYGAAKAAVDVATTHADDTISNTLSSIQ